MTATVAGIHLGIDTHANRPAANTVPDGSLYSCSTHSLVYKSNLAGNSWATWATLGGVGGSVATDAIWDAAGDIVVATGADAASRLAIGTTGKLLKSNGTTASWAYPTFSGCKAYHNTTQGSVGAAITALSLNSEDYDTDSYHDNSTNNSRITVPFTGYYRFTGHAQFANNATCIIGLRVGGTTTVRGSAVAGDGVSEKYQTTAIISLTAAQYVELWGYQSSSGNVGDAVNAENMTSLECQFLGV